MKIKNKIRKASARIEKENNNRVHKLYQEDKYDHNTPYKSRRGKRGVRKPRNKDHR